jgi:PD-(D/E)XK nuclease superfamily
MGLARPLNAKTLEAYALCPMKYHLYRVGDPSHGMTRRIDAARALHAAVRRVLHDCYRAGGPQAAPAEALLEAFTGCFDGGACTDSREEDECREAGLDMLRHYHADHLADGTTEVTVDVALAGTIEGHDFEARADRREVRHDGRIAFLTYTTSRRPPTEGPLEEDLHTGALQLLGEQAEGRPVTIEVHALRTRRVLIATKPAGPLADVRARIVALAAAVTEAERFAATRGRHCRWCHVRSVCPEWRGR